MWRTPGIPALRAIPTQSRIPEILAKTVPPPRHKKTPPHSFQLSPGNLRSGEKASGFPGRRRPGRSNGMRYTGAEPRILPLPGQPRTDHQRTCPSSWRAPAAPDWAPGWGGGTRGNGSGGGSSTQRNPTTHVTLPNAATGNAWKSIWKKQSTYC